MGQYNTKNEEVVIAQAGAQQEYKIKMEIYGALITGLAVCVAFTILCLCCSRCSKCSSRWFRKQVNSSINKAIVLRSAAASSGDATNVSTQSIPKVIIH